MTRRRPTLKRSRLSGNRRVNLPDYVDAPDSRAPVRAEPNDQAQDRLCRSLCKPLDRLRVNGLVISSIYTIRTNWQLVIMFKHFVAMN